MTEVIQAILLSPNAAIVLVFCLLVIIIGLLFSKKGLLHISTKYLQIGSAHRERDIIRQQIEYVKIHYEGIEASMDKPDEYDKWRGRYVVERICDEFVVWITFNHIVLDSAYVEIRQDKIVNLVHYLTIKEEFHSKEFEEWLRKDVKDVLTKLIQIRECYDISSEK